VQLFMRRLPSLQMTQPVQCRAVGAALAAAESLRRELRPHQSPVFSLSAHLFVPQHGESQQGLDKLVAHLRHRWMRRGGPVRLCMGTARVGGEASAQRKARPGLKPRPNGLGLPAGRSEVVADKLQCRERLATGADGAHAADTDGVRTISRSGFSAIRAAACVMAELCWLCICRSVRFLVAAFE
jgi:hypothetical protein